MTHTNRLFLDLENYSDSREAVKVIGKSLKNHPDFIEKKGHRLYFHFKTAYDKLNFIITVNKVLKTQGYMTTIVEETDHYEIEERKRKAAVRNPGNAKRIRTNQQVTVSRKSITSKQRQYNGKGKETH